MLKTVIKRNGERQDFHPEKMAHWAEWAGKELNNRVNWSSIILETCKSLPEEITTQELQQKMVNVCVLRGSWAYSLMGGRLYAALKHKEIHTVTNITEFPTVYDIHEKLRHVGLMKQLKFTLEEYEEINKIIDHKRDFKLAKFQLDQLMKKYSLYNKDTKKIYETPQYVFMRMAMALSEDETTNKLETVKAYYDMFSKSIINSPTPNYINLGTNHNGYASCCLFVSDDNIDSLAIGDHIAYVMTGMSAGIGANINTRSIGDGVRNSSIRHQGKIPYYKSLAGAVHANLQSGRGGACTTYYSIYDSEAEVIALLQNPRTTVDKQNRDIHFAVLYNSLFVEKVMKNEDIFTFNVKSAPDLVDAFYSSDTTLFKVLYQKYENDSTFIKNYVSARKLYITTNQQSYEVGTHYLMFIDNANIHTPHKDKIYSSNLCVAPETLILTREYGYRKIHTLVNKAVTVWNGVSWSKTNVVKTGHNRKLLTVVTDTGVEVDVTPDHKWYVQTFTGHGKAKSIVEKRTKELKPEDALIKFNLETVKHGKDKIKLAYENGLFTGFGEDTIEGSKIILKKDRMSLIDNMSDNNDNFHYHLINKNRIEVIFHKGALEQQYWIPDNTYSLKDRIDWLAGLIDSNGILTSPNSVRSIRFCKSNKEFIFNLRLFLQEVGIYSSVAEVLDYRKVKGEALTGRYKLEICLEGVLRLKELKIKTTRLDLNKTAKEAHSRTKYTVIKAVVDKGRKDNTYCVNEPLRNRVMFNGLLTGNCLEIMLPTKPYQSMTDLYSTDTHEKGEIALCSLAGIVIDNITTDEEYLKAAYYSLKMIDKCIHISDYKLPHLGVTAKARLNAGVGIIGLATHLARKGLSYKTLEGKAEIHRVSERHAYFMIKASLQLGKELGNAPWIEKTNWVNGWLPIDTYNKNVDLLVKPEYVYDWEELRKEIIANGGIRNSTLMAHMPTESSSKAAGVPNGLYPVRDIILKKKDESSVIDWVATDSDIIKYEKAWHIPTLDMIECYAIVQKFTDQGISADLYKNRVDDINVYTEDMILELSHMHKFGMKSRYYQNSLTSNQNGNSVETEVDVGCESGACSL